MEKKIKTIVFGSENEQLDAHVNLSSDVEVDELQSKKQNEVSNALLSYSAHRFTVLNHLHYSLIPKCITFFPSKI